MSRPARTLTGLLLFATLVAAGYALLQTGVYGLTLFALLPVIVGALGTWIARAASPVAAAKVGALTTAGALSLILFWRLEGIICIGMAAPLAVPLGAIGGLLVYYGEASARAKRGVATMLLLPPATLTWDIQAPPELFQVRTAIEIDATPEQVWSHVVTFSDLSEPREWIFRTGLAYPIRARIEGSGPGAVRYCEFSTGPFVEPIEVWDQPHLLRFGVTANPAPMEEWGLFGAAIHPKHLEGYLLSKRGQFKLTPLGPHRTLLEGTTWYQHGLWPATYWRWWSDAIIHRIHLRVLTHIRDSTEFDTFRHLSTPAPN